MKRCLSWLALLAGVLTLSACGALPAQTVSLRPEARSLTDNMGKSKPVALRVVDARSDKTIGYRGTDTGKSATITAEGDLAEIVGKAASRSLTDSGFNPVAFKPGAVRSLTITIRDLSYGSMAQAMTKKVEAKCLLAATVINGPGTYEGTFPVSQEKEVLVTPNETDNAVLINGVLSESLSLLLTDHEIMSFLAKDNVRGKDVKQ
jgi:uncharacterized lipoprotein YajG